MKVEGVDVTNNAAERALRKGVLSRKGSFGNASFRGLRMTERLLTASETCHQQKRSLLAYLTDAISALRAGLPAPKILLQQPHWEDAVKRALRKPRPPEGWSKGDKPKQAQKTKGDG